MEVFVVTLYRTCQRAGTSFPIAVVSSRKSADEIGRSECCDRGFKYGYEVSQFRVDQYDPDADSPLDEIICPHGNPDWPT